MSDWFRQASSPAGGFVVPDSFEVIRAVGGYHVGIVEVLGVQEHGARSDDLGVEPVDCPEDSALVASLRGEALGALRACLALLSWPSRLQGCTFVKLAQYLRPPMGMPLRERKSMRSMSKLVSTLEDILVWMTI